jgi:predicted amidophosphoribosyltransferase
MDEGTKQMGIRIPISMYRKIKLIAHKRNLSVTNITIEALAQYLDNSTPGLCPSCHHQNEPDAKFCQHCGEPISSEIIESMRSEINALKESMRQFQEASKKKS